MTEELGVEYRDIPGFPGYRVGSDGSVWSFWNRGGSHGASLSGRWRKLKPHVEKRTGYLTVAPRNSFGKLRTTRIHNLVLLAFVGPCPSGLEGCHEDGNPANNVPSNLRWDTHDSNMKDMARHGRSNLGIKHPMAKLTDSAVREVRRLARAGVVHTEIARRIGICRQNISHIVLGKRWRHVLDEPEVAS